MIKELANSKAIRNLLLFLAMFLAISLPRMLSIEQSVVVDESKWLVRSANFLSAVSNGSYADTYQREHPGVTTMWAGALGLARLFPEYKDAEITDVDRVQLISMLRQAGYEPLETLVSARVVVVLINSAVLVFVFAYARKLLGTAAATLGTLFIAFSPFHAAHTQILHLDGLMGSFMLLSLLAFLSFGSFQSFSDLIVSSIAAGLSWLTKSPSLVLLPTVGLLALVFYFRRLKSQKDINTIRTLWPTIRELFFWVVIASITFIVLWPAMWVDPIGSVTKILTSAIGYAVEGHDNAIFFDGRIFPDGRIGPEVLHFYPVTYLWRATPVVLFGLPLSLFAFFKRDYPLRRFQSRVTVAGLLLAVVIFVLVMNFGTKKFDRYLIPAYAPLDLISATGWIAFSNVAVKLKSWQHRRLVKLSVLGTAVVLQLLLLLSVYPYYLSYYNVVLGGGKRAQNVMTIGWGEGLDAAARYLNEKPNPGSLRVASWYRNSFLFHFEGQTDSIPSVLDEQGLNTIFEVDYAVIYIHQWQRDLPKILLDRLRERNPEYRVWINGLEYVRIYNLKEGSLESG